MGIDSVSTASAKVTRKTVSSLRRVVSNGAPSELVAVTIPPGKEAGRRPTTTAIKQCSSWRGEVKPFLTAR